MIRIFFKVNRMVVLMTDKRMVPLVLADIQKKKKSRVDVITEADVKPRVG